MKIAYKTFEEMAQSLQIATVQNNGIHIGNEPVDLRDLVEIAHELGQARLAYLHENPDSDVPPPGADLAHRRMVIEHIDRLHEDLDTTLSGKFSRFKNTICWPLRSTLAARIEQLRLHC